MMINQLINKFSKELSELSDEIWDYAEVKFEERKSSEALARFLKKNDFEIEFYQEDLPTAFKATYGQGSPVIGLLGEYDALPDMSQYPGETKKNVIEEGLPGHGCGHNLLGVGSVGAAVVIKNILEEENFTGTIVYYGCPAEEGGGGKGIMATLRAFDNLDLALTWHPFHKSFVLHSTSLATSELEVTFYGKSAHAALEPHKGRSALDGVELMNIGINYLREHIRDEERVHYSIVYAGGKAPNVVPDTATALYKIRALNKFALEELEKRVTDIAKGASLMTGTQNSIEDKGRSLDIIPNLELAKLLYESAKKCPSQILSDEEISYAHQIIETFENVSDENPAVFTDFEVLKEKEGHLAGSTDVGDVSHILPVGQVFVATAARNTPLHSWQMVTQGKSPYAHKGMMMAASILAETCIDIYKNPNLIGPIVEEWKNRTS